MEKLPRVSDVQHSTTIYGEDIKAIFFFFSTRYQDLIVLASGFGRPRQVIILEVAAWGVSKEEPETGLVSAQNPS